MCHGKWYPHQIFRCRQRYDEWDNRNIAFRQHTTCETQETSVILIDTDIVNQLLNSRDSDKHAKHAMYCDTVATDHIIIYIHRILLHNEIEIKLLKMVLIFIAKWIWSPQERVMGNSLFIYAAFGVRQNWRSKLSNQNLA